MVAIATKEIMGTHSHIPVVIFVTESVLSCDVRYSHESVFSGLVGDVFVTFRR